MQAIQASAEVNSLIHDVNLLSSYEEIIRKQWGCIESLRKVVYRCLNVKVASIPDSVYAFPNNEHVQTIDSNSCKMNLLSNNNTRTRQVHPNNVNMPDDYIIMKFNTTKIKSFFQVIDQKSKIEHNRQLNSTILTKLESIEKMLSSR